jgi:hypothetical protein
MSVCTNAYVAAGFTVVWGVRVNAYPAAGTVAGLNAVVIACTNVCMHLCCIACAYDDIPGCRDNCRAKCVTRVCTNAKVCGSMHTQTQLQG